MDGPLLQIPKTGHSRFSKALPAPPSGLEDSLRTIPRKLPSLPASPLPPRKDSAGVKVSANLDSKSNPVNSPLPTIPQKMETTQLPRQMSIPRRPVGQSTTQLDAPATTSRINKLKRNSSISSILSAYSHTSSGSVQRSSQDSYHTKDSEPSYSPEREGMNEKHQESTKAFSVFSGNPYADELSQGTDGTRGLDQLPPPPPLKDVDRPSTPSTVRPVDSPLLPNGAPMTSSPTSSVNGSPQQREIWRRRASSKSDRSLAVAGLKLTTSHGSTAATLQAVKADPQPLLPPPPVQNNTPTTAALPPRGASLPGRNIRPIRPANPENDEMAKLPGLSKLKELVKRGSSPKDEHKGDHELQTLPNKPELKVEGQVESEASVKSPNKHQPATKEESASVQGPVAEMVAPSASSVSSPEYPPSESAKKAIPRRPVGNSKRDEPGVQKKQSTPELSTFSRKSPSQSSSGGSRRSPSPHSRSRPRQSRSNSALNLSASHNVQETVMAKAPAALVRSPVASQAPEAERTKASIAQPLQTPANADEPLKKSELFELVSSLNEADISPKDSAPRKITAPAPSRKVASKTHAVPLSDVNEGIEEAAKGMDLSEDQIERLNHALSRFPRNWEFDSSSGGIIPTGPLLEKHHHCYTKHGTFVFAKNVNYSLACQACGVADNNTRKVCAWCNLRICMRCHGLLQSNGRDLKTLMAVLEEEKRQEKGKNKEVIKSVGGNNSY
ncbi:hypothetical protein F5X99DRAFT_151148 [Biscogniauxia marginata]|nr:hypothetical protein F5X99DRAFT_151148 [Biscogniauxia marginata]